MRVSIVSSPPVLSVQISLLWAKLHLSHHIRYVLICSVAYIPKPLAAGQFSESNRIRLPDELVDCETKSHELVDCETKSHELVDCETRYNELGDCKTKSHELVDVRQNLMN